MGWSEFKYVPVTRADNEVIKIWSHLVQGGWAGVYLEPGGRIRIRSPGCEVLIDVDPVRVPCFRVERRLRHGGAL